MSYASCESCGARLSQRWFLFVSLICLSSNRIHEHISAHKTRRNKLSVARTEGIGFNFLDYSIFKSLNFVKCERNRLRHLCGFARILNYNFVLKRRLKRSSSKGVYSHKPSCWHIYFISRPAVSVFRFSTDFGF